MLFCVASWAISVYYAYQRTWKPFNPILGETYEMINHGGITFISEQVRLQLFAFSWCKTCFIPMVQICESAFLLFIWHPNLSILDVFNLYAAHVSKDASFLILFFIIIFNCFKCWLSYYVLISGEPSSPNGCWPCWKWAFCLWHHIKVED